MSIAHGSAARYFSLLPAASISDVPAAGHRDRSLRGRAGRSAATTTRARTKLDLTQRICFPAAAGRHREAFGLDLRSRRLGEIAAAGGVFKHEQLAFAEAGLLRQTALPQRHAGFIEIGRGRDGCGRGEIASADDASGLGGVHAGTLTGFQKRVRDVAETPTNAPPRSELGWSTCLFSPCGRGCYPLAPKIAD